MTLRVGSKFCSKSELIYVLKDKFRTKLKQCADSRNIHLWCLISFCNCILHIFYYFMIVRTFWHFKIHMTVKVLFEVLYAFRPLIMTEMFVLFPELQWSTKLFMYIITFELLLVHSEVEKIKLYNLLLCHTLQYSIMPIIAPTLSYRFL